MKNVLNRQLKTCILLLYWEFEDVMHNIGIQAENGFEGLAFSKDGEDMADCEVCTALSEYFDVEVTSVHCDDYDFMGVWIVYKEEEANDE